jgi:hypothetical protein
MKQISICHSVSLINHYCNINISTLISWQNTLFILRRAGLAIWLIFHIQSAPINTDWRAAAPQAPPPPLLRSCCKISPNPCFYNNNKPYIHIICIFFKVYMAYYYLSFTVIVDFNSLFNARFPSSLQTCQLRFQVRKLGVNFATKFPSTFQCLNYCK